MQVSRKSFQMEIVADDCHDLSYLGEYSNAPSDIAIDRMELGHMARGEYRYFNPAMSEEETGNPDSPRQDYERMEAYNRGEWGMVGIRAKVELRIHQNGLKDHFILQTITSPGLWGIESDSGNDYFDSVFKDECETLADMLEEMGIEVID